MSQNFWQAAQFNTVWQSPSLEIVNIRYQPLKACFSEHIEYSGFGFFFYRKGFFDLKLNNQRYSIDPTCLVMNHHGVNWQVGLKADSEVNCSEIHLNEHLFKELSAYLTSPKKWGQREKVSFRVQSPTRHTSNEIRTLYAALLQEAKEKKPGYTMLMESLALAMSVNAIRQFIGVSHSSVYLDKKTKKKDAILEKIEQAKFFIEQHLCRELTLHEVAQHIQLSSFYVLRQFRAETGLTPHQYLTNQRLLKAQELLLDTKKDIAEIAMSLGYSNPSHFSALFRKNVGCNPLKFRRTGPTY